MSALTRIKRPDPALALLAAFAALAAYHATQFQHVTSDTLGLLRGVGVIDQCLHAHKWSCGASGFGYIGPSALLQYLPGLAFKRLGMSFDSATHALVYLNTLAFLLTLVVLWRTGRRVGDVRLAAVLALIGIAGPMLWYSSAGFGEGLGVFFVTGFTCACVVRAGGVTLMVMLWIAAISKEPALPFLLGIAFVVLRQPTADGLPRLRRSQAAGVVAGALLGLATNIGFNAFRSGHPASGARPLTASIAHIAAPAPTIAQKAEAFFSLFLAPNVGLLWFWPIALACVVLGLLAARRAASSARTFLDSAPVGTLIVMGLFIAGVSSFAAPYGFVAWGPRYLVPWVPSFALMAVAANWRTCRDLIDRLRRRTWVVGATGVAIAVLAVSQLTAFLYPPRVYAHFGAGGACPTPLDDITEWYQQHGEIDSYYACTRYLAWTKGPLLLQVDRELGKATSVGYLVVYLAAVGALLVVVAGGGVRMVSLRPERAAG